MRNIILGVSALALAAVAAPAMAQDLSGFSVSGNAAVVTDYRFRGVSLSGVSESWPAPAAQVVVA